MNSIIGDCFFEDVKDNETGLKFYNEQKDQLMKLQMKLFCFGCHGTIRIANG